MDQNELLFNEVLSNLLETSDINVMEFGVASGNTACAILNVLLHRNVTVKRYIGFDSFLGLPKEENGVPIHNDWSVGAFNILHENRNNNKILNKADTTEEAIEHLFNRLKGYEKHGIKVDIVKGIYQDTLNSETLKSYEIEPADFIHIDCDLYISSIQALEFIFSNDLLKMNGILRYDDMRGCPDDGGEKRAHKKIQEKYRLMFNSLSNDAYIYTGKQI